MVDYQQLYVKMMKETERAIECLIEAQRACEELYLQMEEEPKEIPEILHFVQNDSYRYTDDK